MTLHQSIYDAHIVTSELGLGSDQLVLEVQTQVASAEVAVRVANTPGALAIIEARKHGLQDPWTIVACGDRVSTTA